MKKTIIIEITVLLAIVITCVVLLKNRNEGNENTVTYHGWMTGPNETTALWNTKKGVVWNDMNYTKLLYITKDEDTLAFFQRFDRIIINGKPW
jgi:hypothetical protein